MNLLVVLMFIVMLLSSVYEMKKLTVRRFSFETIPEFMTINISITFISNEFTLNLDQWVVLGPIPFSVSKK